VKTEKGRRLADRYRLDEPLAGGGMAEVWRARDEVLGRPVAVKVLHDHLAADEGFFERFRREAITAARLSHAAVVRVFDTGVDGKTCFIVMELYEGLTLAEVLAHRGPLPPEEAVDIVRGILDGLAHAHDHGVVHRDVKPGNVLVRHQQVKVADFGIAKAAFGTDLTTTGQLLGTSKYLSPEQVRGGELDHRADLYSVGVVLYELLTGRAPFEAETAIAEATMRLTTDPRPASHMRAGIPRELDAIVMRALARYPDDRFQSAQEMRATLERWTMEAAVAEPARPVPEAPLAPPPSFFRSWMLVPLLIVFLAAAAVGIGLFVGGLELGGPLGVRPAEDPNGRDRGQAIQVASVQALDPEPEGDGDEHGDEAPLAIDGDGSTSWPTEGYRTSDLGGLKEGVGLVLDLGKPTEVSEVTLETSLPGWTFELRPSEDGSSLDDPIPDSDGETTFEAADGEAIELESVQTRYLTVWIRDLVEDEDGRYRALVSEVEVAGA
jgi:hypothetical protein